jgi:hypothetical protein
VVGYGTNKLSTIIKYFNIDLNTPHKTTSQDLIFTVAFFNDSFLEGYGFSTTTITIIIALNGSLTKRLSKNVH